MGLRWDQSSIAKEAPCTLCNKVFTETHARTQWRAKSGKSFTVASNLKDQKRIHSGEKPYQCTYCDYSCADSGHLKTHERKHTDTKPHRCTQCEYTCIQSSTLHKHMMTHTGERPHRCTLCEFMSAQPGTLKRHMRIHSGE